jgi:hypothetical protein
VTPAAPNQAPRGASEPRPNPALGVIEVDQGSVNEQMTRSLESARTIRGTGRHGAEQQLLRLLGQAGVSAEPLSPDALREWRRERVREMYELYEEGRTLEEVGRHFQVTRERVRQLFRQEGLKVRSVGETAALHRAQLRDSRRSEISQLYRSGRSAEEITAELGLSKAIVDEVLKEQPSYRRRRRISAKTSHKPFYTNEEIIACLQEASLELGGILTTANYTKLAKTKRFADGRPWPSHQTPFHRFGSWRAALAAAGLLSNPPSAIAGKRIFTKAHCVEAILEVEQALGHLPTAAEYEEYAVAMSGALPSLATIRHRLGRWSDALRIAVEFSEETPD